MSKININQIKGDWKYMVGELVWYESLLGSQTHSNFWFLDYLIISSTLLIYLIIIKSRYRIKLVEVTL